MKRLSLLFSLVVLTATCVAQTSDATPAPERSLAVNVMRMLNTVEVTYIHDSGHFGTWSELRPMLAKYKEQGSKAWANAFSAMNMDSDEDPLPGWDLRVVVSSDGKHYSLGVRNKEYCDVNAFSDERGVIYMGTALGCQRTLASQ